MKPKEVMLAISASDAQALVDYLQTKPWAEVNHLVVCLLKLETTAKKKKAADNA